MYREFFGFTRCPFQLAPDPSAYFESLSQRQAFSCLNHALVQGEGFVVVTGDVGTGKSALIGRLLRAIDQSLLSVGVISGHLDADTVIPTVARAFPQLVSDDSATDLDLLKAFREAEAQSGRRCLLVVDDAQHSSIGALEALSRLSAVHSGAHAGLQVLLVGTPEVRSRLHDRPELEQLRQRIIAAHRLDPFEAGEVERYIEHRLTCVGWTGNPAFAPRVFVELHAATGGVPARINQIANRLLLLAAAGQKELVDGDMLKQALSELIGLPWLVHQAELPAEEKVMALHETFPGALENALARCEGRIARLQQVVADLAGSAAPSGRAMLRQETAALEDRLSSLESRLIEQEGTIRHTLTTLIDWIERDEAHHVAI